MHKDTLTVKNYNPNTLLASLLLIIIGAVVTYFIPPNLAFESIEPYVGLILFMVGILVLFMWETTETVFDKDAGLATYRRKTITSIERDRSFEIHKINSVLFYDKKANPNRPNRYGSASGVPRIYDKNFMREIKIKLEDDTVYSLKKNESNFAIWGRGIESEAKKIADFLEVELKTLG